MRKCSWVIKKCSLSNLVLYFLQIKLSKDEFNFKII